MTQERWEATHVGSEADRPPLAAVRLLIWTEPDFDDDGPALACRTCSSALQLHQPDPSDPGRLLGTCPVCRDWHLVEVFEARPGAAIAALPAGAIALSALGPRQTPPGHDGSG